MSQDPYHSACLPIHISLLVELHQSSGNIKFIFEGLVLANKNICHIFTINVLSRGSILADTNLVSELFKEALNSNCNILAK